MPDDLTPIPWTADLEVGVEHIDLEHRTLVMLYNDFISAIHHKVSAAMRRGFLDTVQKHLRLHMANEEAYLRDRAHPQAEQHEREHQDGKAALTALLSLDDDHRDPRVVARSLHDWIVRHICVEDREIFASLLAPPATEG